MTTPTDIEALALFAPVALRLLNHVVASEEGPYWNLLLRYTDALRDYFARIGLALIVSQTQPRNLAISSHLRRFLP